MASKVVKEKGHTTYHPKESFMLSVDWVLRNEECAMSMLRDGLQGCAKATLRDTPCVPMYFFRVAYDQSEAIAFDEATKTLADHPHYSKVFKSLEMGLPLGSQLVKLKAGGIDPDPIEWGIDKVLDAPTKAKIGFRPTVVSLSEVYLDSRAFYEHADSPDYLKSYGVVMEANRSLKATSRCLGTPTDHMFQTVLSPYLQAILCEDSFVHHVNPDARKEAFSEAFLEFSLTDSTNWRARVEHFVASLNSSSSAGWKVDDKVRVELSFSFVDDVTFWEKFHSAVLALGVRAGQLFAFSSSPAKPAKFPSMLKFISCSRESLFGKGEDESKTICWAGYVMHPQSSVLQPDETVVWKRS